MTRAESTQPNGPANHWDDAALLALLLVSADQKRRAADLWRQHSPPLLASLLDGTTFDPATQAYSVGGAGRSPRGLADDAARHALLLFLAAVSLDLQHEAEQMARGEVTVAMWQDTAAGVIRSAYVAAYALGVGGTSRLEPLDLAAVRGTAGGVGLADSLVRLERFAKLVVARDPAVSTIDAVEARAGLYVGPAYALYEAGRSAGHRRSIEANGMPRFTVERSVLEPGAEHCHSTSTAEGCTEAAAAGWVPIGTLPPVGTRACGPQCRCRTEYGRGQTEVERN